MNLLLLKHQCIETKEQSSFQCLIAGSKVDCFLFLDTQRILLASVIALSFIVFVSLIINCGLIWQRRRAVPNKRIQSKEEIDFDGVKSSPDQQSSNEQASDPNTYMELKPRPSNQESRVPPEYQSLQENPENRGYFEYGASEGKWRETK